MQWWQIHHYKQIREMLFFQVDQHIKKYLTVDLALTDCSKVLKNQFNVINRITNYTKIYNLYNKKVKKAPQNSHLKLITLCFHVHNMLENQGNLTRNLHKHLRYLWLSVLILHSLSIPHNLGHTLKHSLSVFNHKHKVCVEEVPSNTTGENAEHS